jgi:K+-sensing histidine kinase KdpD
MPYAVVTFAIYIIVPLLFNNEALGKFVGVELYFIFPLTAIVSAAIYSAKYGLDFLFSLIAPILFLPTMFIFCGGFAGQYALHNILLIVIYLVAAMFGLFVGDIAFGDKRRQREKEEREETEEMLLEAKRRDEKFLRNQVKKSTAQKPKRPVVKNEINLDDDDFNYDKYLSDIDKNNSDSISTESEIDDILSEFGH